MIQLSKTIRLSLAALAFASLWSCKESIDTSSRYVFKEETVMSYLEKHEAYSSYVELLKQVKISEISDSKVGQLLSARGAYTVFAPTNEAIQAYLQTLVEQELISEPSWDAFTDAHKLDSIRKVIVHNSVINHGDATTAYYVANFPVKDNEEFVLANLNDTKLSVHYPTNGNYDEVYINGDCLVSETERDILAINGIIHQVKKVIAPNKLSAAKYIVEYIGTRMDPASGEYTGNGVLAMLRAVQACGLLDTLGVLRDEVYETKYQRGEIEDLVGMTSYGFAEGNTAAAPKHRKYGYTIFAETDDKWRERGIDPAGDDLLEKMTKWILENNQYAQEDNFITSTDPDSYAKPEHLLYQWVTYHMLPMRLTRERLAYHVNEYGYNRSKPYSYTIPVEEFYTTMGQRRLLKISESGYTNAPYINRFPIVNNERQGNGLEIGCKPGKEGILINADHEQASLTDMENCIIYPIEEPLAYTDNVRDDLKAHRIRFDGMSLFPEAVNNDIRLKPSSLEADKWVYIPNTERSYNYLENMQQNAKMDFVYYNVRNTDDWCNLYRDEMKAVGRYEVTFKLPPVPRRGTYEIRYKVLANDNRGVAQIYFGTDPRKLHAAGIPLDLTLDCRKAYDAQVVGWTKDTGDDDMDALNDKQLRNKGYMKAPKSIASQDQTTERDENHRENIRHIFVRETLDPSETYYIKLKSVLDSDRKEFYMDFIEYCAKEIYDNPETPEDIW